MFCSVRSSSALSMRGRPAGWGAEATVNCSTLRAARASPLEKRAMADSASSSASGCWRPRPRSASVRARRRMLTMAPSSRGLRTNTFDRERSAAFTSNDGFSVVAPIRTISPLSTRGKNASCCALLKRWISSMKTMVRRPVMRRRCSAAAITSFTSLMPARTALNAMNSAFVRSAMSRASVVLPVPGGPQRMIDCSRSRSIISRSGRPGAISSSWPTISSSERGRMRSARGTVRGSTGAGASSKRLIGVGGAPRTAARPRRPRHSVIPPAPASGC